MTRIVLILFTVFLSGAVCAQVGTGDSISTQIRAAKDSSITITGRFIKIEPVGPNFCNLYLRLDDNSVGVFYSPMLLGPTEIKYLKKHGDNIELAYREYHNPVTGKTDKIASFIQPIYDLKKLKTK